MRGNITYIPYTHHVYLTWPIYFLLPLPILWIAHFFPYKQRKKQAKMRSMLCCLMTVMCIGVVYYMTFISYFYGYKAEKETGIIELQYIVPQRTKTLMIQDVSTVTAKRSFKGSYQIIIIMKNGKRHKGVPSLKIDAENAEKEIRSAML